MASVKRITTEALRAYQWDKSNLWDIYIDGAPDFSGWLPVTQFEVAFWGITTETIGGTGLGYPSLRTPPTMCLSYIDTEDLVMTRFFSEWSRSLSSSNGYRLKTIDEARRNIIITKLNSKKEAIIRWTGSVYPDGAVTYQGDSDGSVPMYQVNLIVVSGSLKWQDQNGGA